MKKKSVAVFKCLIDFIFPRHCYGCRNTLEFYEKNLCLGCQIKLPHTSLHLTHKNLLYEQLKFRIPLEAATSLFYFEKNGVLAHLIHLLKYSGEKKIGAFLGSWLGDHLEESPFFNEIDGIVPVPLHPVKKRKRGYNQADLIAHALSKKINSPVLSKILIRVKNTSALAQLGESEREQEVQNAFELNSNKLNHSQHLLLVDDVLTTGATLTACANALAKNGNIKLSIAVLACRL